jgi:hypothetical protein
MDDDPAWRMLDPGELLQVSPTLEVRSRVILDAPPVHLLTLADLGACARVSQAKVSPPHAS